MSRSKWKGPFIDIKLIKDIKTNNKKSQNIIKAVSRCSEIVPGFVGINFDVYNGKKFSKIVITEEMIGFKLGEFSSTRKKFSFKKKKRNKNLNMAQKVNSNIFRLGIKKIEWKSKYFENTKEEFSLYTYQSLEIKNFLRKFLAINGLIFHDFKLKYSGNTIYLFISYYTTSKVNSLINKINVQQNFKLKKNNSYNQLKLKKKIKQRFLFPITKYNKRKIEKSFKKKYIRTFKNKKTREIIRKRIKILKNYKINLKFKDYKNIKHLKLNKFSEQLLESISVYTNKKFNIFITFQNLNKGLSLNLTQIQKNFLKKKNLELRRESRNKFFKETVNILVIIVTRKNSAQLLAEFIAYQLSINKKHNFFLLFVKRFLNTLISEEKFSNVSGVKFTIKGRFNGAPRAHKRIYTSGNVPIQTIDSNISYYQATSYTPNGTFGIKVWICKK